MSWWDMLCLAVPFLAVSTFAVMLSLLSICVWEMNGKRYSLRAYVGGWIHFVDNEGNYIVRKHISLMMIIKNSTPNRHHYQQEHKLCHLIIIHVIFRIFLWRLILIRYLEDERGLLPPRQQIIHLPNGKSLAFTLVLMLLVSLDSE